MGMSRDVKWAGRRKVRGGVWTLITRPSWPLEYLPPRLPPYPPVNQTCQLVFRYSLSIKIQLRQLSGFYLFLCTKYM